MFRNMMRRGGWTVYMEQATGDEGGSSAGGSGGGTDETAAAAATAAAKTGEGDEGKNKPTDAEAKLLKEVMDKKNALKATKEQVTDLQLRLAKFDGIDLDAVNAMLNEKKTSETKKLEEQGAWERLKQQMAEEHGKEKTALQVSLEVANANTAALQNTIAELTVGNSFAQSKFIADELALTANKTRVVYGNHFEFKDGKVVGFDKPTGSATRTPLVDASGEPLSFEDALKKIVNADPDRDQLLRSKMKSGANSTTVPKAGAPSVVDAPVISGRDRIAGALSKGGLK